MLSASEILLFLRKNKQLLKDQYHCKEIGLFGSFSRNEQTENSDIDILIVFDEGTPDLYKIENDLKSFLSDHFNRNVVICAKKWINPIFMPLVLSEAIYA
jgi:uncharacterized protein